MGNLVCFLSQTKYAFFAATKAFTYICSMQYTPCHIPRLYMQYTPCHIPRFYMQYPPCYIPRFYMQYTQCHIPHFCMQYMPHSTFLHAIHTILYSKIMNVLLVLLLSWTFFRYIFSKKTFLVSFLAKPFFLFFL